MRILFPSNNDIFEPEIPNGKLTYYPNFLSKEKADELFKSLRKNTPWQKDKITVFGKIYDQPRLTSLYAHQDKPYSYSNLTMYPHKMTPELNALIQQLESIGEYSFNAVLLNLYRDGKDSNGWHADNEKELGKNPKIASISLGEERFFHLKHKTEKEQRYKLKLAHGSLLIMEGEMQHFWLHQIAKTKQLTKERINLTFRLLV